MERCPFRNSHRDLLERNEERHDRVEPRTAGPETESAEEPGILPDVPSGRSLPLGDVEAGCVVPFVAELALEHVARLGLAAEAVDDGRVGGFPASLVSLHLLQVLVTQLLHPLSLEETEVKKESIPKVKIVGFGFVCKTFLKQKIMQL